MHRACLAQCLRRTDWIATLAVFPFAYRAVGEEEVELVWLRPPR
jgi:hypothetical protein